MIKLNMEKVTVIIPTFNVENLIEKAIKSVLWADEILVVDSYSTDSTIAIAKKYGARVIQHEYVYSAKQKNWAIPQAKNNWVLLLDSDEIVSNDLAQNIKKLLSSNKINVYDGYAIGRKHFFFGKFLRWGGRYPLYNIRLFKKSCRYEDRDVHAHIILDKKKMKKTKGDILHFSDRTISQFLEKVNRYSAYQADYMAKVSDRGIDIDWINFLTNGLYFKSIIKDLWNFIPGSPMFRFIYMYILRLGFLDGKSGLVIALAYSLQDYIAKTKYFENYRKDTRLRIRFQRLLTKELCYRLA
jgi:glycosyltransferase involved in cell wall biosynthesis